MCHPVSATPAPKKGLGFSGTTSNTRPRPPSVLTGCSLVVGGGVRLGGADVKGGGGSKDLVERGSGRNT